MPEIFTYQAAGVDIDKGNELVDKIKNMVPTTHRPGVLGGIGGFGGCFELPAGYQHPVLVSSTDGVGTKLRLAIDLQQHATIGIDLVAMCVNDLIVLGAEPLFFLDYYATGKLEVTVAQEVIAGIVKGCQEANIALLGGETAEMPGLYAAKDYDLAGFTVGIVEKNKIVDGRTIQPGDQLIALASSGAHSNGYSLIRRILQKNPLSSSTEELRKLHQQFLIPTRIYVKSLLELVRQEGIKGAAHITGGGLTENVPRMLPSDCSAWIDTKSWQLSSLFQWLQTAGALSNQEMRRTFNCGVGMIVCVSPEKVEGALHLFKQAGETAWVIGHIQARSSDAAILFSDE